MLENETAPLATAKRLFDELARETADPPGVSRDSFGKGEAYAHAAITREAQRLGLEARTDSIGNLYVTLPGEDRNAPVFMTGSHIDSVHHGGNYDGAAGVIAGLATLEWLALQGITPAFDVTLMVIRAEETVWFPEHYLGSRAAFGLLPKAAVDTKRADTGRTLAAHMLDYGFDPTAISESLPQLDPNKIRAFVELHIEQGPVLIEQSLSVGIVSAICGNIRYRFSTIKGQTTHAGAVPRAYRKDAVLAGGEILRLIEDYWDKFEAENRYFTATAGQFATHAATHGITKVPGELSFTLDFRSTDGGVLDEFDAALKTKIREIEERRGVTIDLGYGTRAHEAVMDAGLRGALHAAAKRQEIEVLGMPSGGGHDCAVFSGQGVPSAMIFVANRYGSHNPDEAMEFADFAQAWRVLAAFVKDYVRGG